MIPSREVYSVFSRKETLLLLREGGNVGWIVTSSWGLSEALYLNFPFNPQNRALTWLLLSFKIFFFFGLRRAAYNILVPQPGIEPIPLALRVQSLNHWTTREVPIISNLQIHKGSERFSSLFQDPQQVSGRAGTQRQKNSRACIIKIVILITTE